MPSFFPAWQRPLLRAFVWLLLWSALWPVLVLAADRAPVPTAKAVEWSITADGQGLFQRSTGLVWSRCVVGMHWNGRVCVGEPQWLDLPQAQAMARERAQADGLPWRLPHLRELQQFARLGKLPEQTLLPEASQGWVWSASVPIATHEVNPYTYQNVMNGVNGQNAAQMKFLHGWVVNTATGESRSDVLRRTPMFVQLVHRAGH